MVNCMRRALWIILLVLLAAPPARAGVAIIANDNVPVDSITRDDLLDLYTGDVRKWNDGRSVVVMDLKERGELRDLFYAFLGKTPSRMKSIWLRKMLAGEADPPESLASEEEMVEKVRRTAGAIGFVDSSRVLDSVKVLAVIEDDSQ